MSAVPSPSTNCCSHRIIFVVYCCFLGRLLCFNSLSLRCVSVKEGGSFLIHCIVHSLKSDHDYLKRRRQKVRLVTVPDDNVISLTCSLRFLSSNGAISFYHCPCPPADMMKPPFQAPWLPLARTHHLRRCLPSTQEAKDSCPKTNPLYSGQQAKPYRPYRGTQLYKHTGTRSITVHFSQALRCGSTDD